MQTRHSQAVGSSKPNGPGSEAIALRFANQQKTDVIARRDDCHETASSHLRNALQILEGLGWALTDRDTWTLELEGLRDRIRRALFLVEKPPLVTYHVTDRGRAELEHLEGLELEARELARVDRIRSAIAGAAELGARLVIQPAACVYCGCTQHSACAVQVDQLSDDARNALELYSLERGAQLGETAPCWWISLTPPVCSAPACAAALEEARALRASRFAPLATRAPEHGGPV